MKRVLTAVVLVPLVLLVVFRAPLWLFVFVVGLVILMCLREFLDIVERYGIKPLRRVTYLVSILVIVQTYILFAVMYDTGSPHYLTDLRISQGLQSVVPLLIPIIFGVPVVFRRELTMALGASAASAFGVFYISIPLTLVVAMRWTPDRAILLIFTLISVWAGDIAAYYVGKNIGRHKLAPVVSPKKTWEGAIASLAASLAVAGVIFHFHNAIGRWFAPSPGYDTGWRSDDLTFHLVTNEVSVNPWVIYSLGAVANIAAQFGDLFESAIKRGAQVKDSSSLLPGHGGILDRIDALLFAIPAVWYYASLIR